MGDHCEDCIRIMDSGEPYNTCEYCEHVYLIKDGKCNCSTAIIARGEML